MTPDEVLAKARALCRTKISTFNFPLGCGTLGTEKMSFNLMAARSAMLPDLIALAERQQSEIKESYEREESARKDLADFIGANGFGAKDRQIAQLQEALVEERVKFIWMATDGAGHYYPEHETEFHERDRSEFYAQARRELSIQKHPRLTAEEKESLHIAIHFMQKERDRLQKIDRRTASFMVGDDDAIAILRRMLEEE